MQEKAIFKLSVHQDSGGHDACFIENEGRGYAPIVVAHLHGLVQRIRNMQTLCKAHDLYKVTDWDSTPVWGDLMCGDGERIIPDCGMLHVTKFGFWFDCTIKHTDVKIVTECVLVSELRARGLV